MQLAFWKIFDYIRTGFKGYHYSEGDGVFYYYSILEDVRINETEISRCLLYEHAAEWFEPLQIRSNLGCVRNTRSAWRAARLTHGHEDISTEARKARR